MGKEDLDKFAKWDERLVDVAKKIKVLTAIQWPEKLSPVFIEAWRRGRPELPKVEYPKCAFRKEIAELKAICAGVDRGHPVGEFLFQTADSYAAAAAMLEGMGTPAFTDHSIRIYGRPTDSISPEGPTHVDAADAFIASTGEFIEAYFDPSNELCLAAKTVAQEIRDRLVPHFVDHEIRVELDATLSSKAAAGGTRIRLRDATCFTENDIQQLVNHEGFVHMLTAINGREQKHLTALSLGAPRTTRTQEGLATFAELITSSMDLSRLRRLALRIRGVEMGLEGADFVQVFRFFLEAGQDESESFQSAARIFRGGDPKGKIVFTKDSVYLQGLIFVHTFLRKAVQENKYHYAEHLFAGRLTLGDVVALEPFFQSGYIQPPRYEPPWLRRRECLAAYLCYAVFVNRIRLGDLTIDDFRTRGL